MTPKQQQNGHLCGNETMNLTELVQMTFLNLPLLLRIYIFYFYSISFPSILYPIYSWASHVFLHSDFIAPQNLPPIYNYFYFPRCNWRLSVTGSWIKMHMHLNCRWNWYILILFQPWLLPVFFVNFHEFVVYQFPFILLRVIFILWIIWLSNSFRFFSTS